MKKCTPFNFDGKIFVSRENGFQMEYCNYKDIDLVLNYAISENDLCGNSKSEYIYNIPCAFDIETSSFYRDLDGKTYNYNQIKNYSQKDREKLEKLGIMYVWQFGLNGYIFIGREWKEFIYLINRIKTRLQLNENKRLIIYVHNLSFEFQFICKLFEFQKVFAIDLRRPIYAITDGLEFRCSYLLSGYNLETLAKNLLKYKIKKLVGNLDYFLIRTPQTPINENELDYCVNDVKIVMLYILEYIENVKNIQNIPLTKTGAVRKFCRKNCFYVNTENYKGVNYNYKRMIKNLQINDLHEFKTLQRAFSGGFTHANANYSDKTILNVSSFDFTSSYPFVMVSEKYPMSSGYKYTPENESELNEVLTDYLSVFDVEFFDIFSRETFENYISVSKCFIKEKFAENNGRLICAKHIILTVTNIDYIIIKKLYTWKKCNIGNMYVYEKQFLPSEFVGCIIDLYKKKTELKGIDGKENEYLNAKEMLNSCYGMSVTNPLRNEFTFDVNGWKENELTDNEKRETLLKYNFAENRFLFYLWGVFVTAYARRNLFTGIFELKNDYVYSDTDSVKFINLERHKLYFETYNKLVVEKLKKACDFHGIELNNVMPKNKKGETKILGIWEFEGTYTKFKTLGAKRYMIQKENALTVGNNNYNFSLTVSGVNKKNAIPYLLEKYGENGIFNAFTNYLEIPENATGKNIHTYIDYETNGKVIDYLGNEYLFECKSGVHLEPTSYTLNLSVQYLQLITNLKTLKSY